MSSARSTGETFEGIAYSHASTTLPPIPGPHLENFVERIAEASLSISLSVITKVRMNTRASNWDLIIHSWRRVARAFVIQRPLDGLSRSDGGDHMIRFWWTLRS
jgi:hypothetical protein